MQALHRAVFMSDGKKIRSSAILENMSYLYHAVPKNLEGNILYPLNTLKEKYQDIYDEHVSKYIGREHVTQQKIPILDCLWNDVLFFCAVNPKEIKEALIEAGRNPNFTKQYYQVDPKLIDPNNAVVWLFNHVDDKNKMNKENFVSYNPDEVARFSVLPPATKDYYQKIISQGERPLLYYRIPHILYKGTLDITNLPIIVV